MCDLEQASEDDGTGRVRLAESLPFGEVSRDDVAAVLAEPCRGPVAVRRTLELVAGDTPIPEAVAAVDALPGRPERFRGEPARSGDRAGGRRARLGATARRSRCRGRLRPQAACRQVAQLQSWHTQWAHRSPSQWSHEQLWWLQVAQVQSPQSQLAQLSLQLAH